MPTPMPPERLEDRFRFYRAKPHQQQGIRLLHQAIQDGIPPEQVLVEEAPWALAYSQAPLALSPSVGLDPRGVEEEGLAGPSIAAPVMPGDSYLLVNDRDQDMEAYDHSGCLLWRVPCLARGQGRDNQWRERNSDTSTGIGAFKSTRCVSLPRSRPEEQPPSPLFGYSHGLRLVFLRHGGAGGAGGGQRPERNHAPRGRLCLRLHNIDLRDRVLPLAEQGTVYVGVFQEP